MKLHKARVTCKVRGFIFRASKPEYRFFKNSIEHNQQLDNICKTWLNATDWQAHDPQEDESFAETA